jgi:hypothetical protein
MAWTPTRGAEAMRFFTAAVKLGGGVLVGGVQDAVDHAVGAGLVDLGEVGALLVLLAHDGDDLVGGVGVVGVGEHVLGGVVADGVFVAAEMSMALPLMRRRGPGMRPALMASRMAVSAEPAPSVPMSRSAVKPASRSALAACSARITRQGTDSSTVCRSSAPGWRKRWTWASMRPGSSVVSPRSMILALAGMVDGCADGANAVALDEDFAGLEERAGVDLEQAGGVEDDGGLGGGVAAEDASSRESARAAWVKEGAKSRHERQDIPTTCGWGGRGLRRRGFVVSLSVPVVVARPDQDGEARSARLPLNGGGSRAEVDRAFAGNCMKQVSSSGYAALIRRGYGGWWAETEVLELSRQERCEVRALLGGGQGEGGGGAGEPGLAGGGVPVRGFPVCGFPAGCLEGSLLFERVRWPAWPHTCACRP